jgi:hypothetical protein
MRDSWHYLIVVASPIVCSSVAMWHLGENRSLFRSSQ